MSRRYAVPCWLPLIDRKITKYFMAMEGIVKKLENDKYLFVIKQQYTKEIQESRFSILEDVKTVNIGNDMAVTLSIGMGMNGDSYIRNYEYARTAIDMALGRGGDQAVVKDGTKIRYYGGKSQQLEKTTRVKARVKAHAMRELMDTKDKMLIMGHKILAIRIPLARRLVSGGLRPLLIKRRGSSSMGSILP